MGTNIEFHFGTRTQYNAILEKNENYLYLVDETEGATPSKYSLYKGTNLIASNVTADLGNLNSRVSTTEGSIATINTNLLDLAELDVELAGKIEALEAKKGFKEIHVGDAVISADSAEDSVTLAGSNITLTPNPDNDSITIGITKDNVTAALGYTPPTQDTTYDEATVSEAGLMSADDKNKLDGIEMGAQANSITGVKGDAESSYRIGEVNITKDNIGLGNVQNVAALPLTGGTLSGTLGVETSGSGALISTGRLDTDRSIWFGIGSGGENAGIYDYNKGDWMLVSTREGTPQLKGNADTATSAVTATTASKLNVNAGDSNTPVYFANGVPVACTSLDLDTSGSSASCTGNAATATTASKLGSSTVGGVKNPIYLEDGIAKAITGTVGSANKPVFLDEGILSECSYTIDKSVPSTAIFTNMTGATSSAAGSAGYVPAPAAGKQASFLKGDGSWDVPIDTKYSAGTGLSLTGTQFKNTGVTSVASGSSNGTIAVSVGGAAATNVAVKGLGSAAYTASTAYDAKGSAAAAETNAKAYSDTKLTEAKAYTDSSIDGIVGDGAADALNTIEKISTALKNDATIIDAINASIDSKTSTIATNLNTHITNKSNPHAVTKAQIGLGNVDNTADANKSVKYATSAGSATTATKLGTDGGSTTQPVYFTGGVPKACTYTLGKSVPSDAKFTDTTYNPATTSTNGLMSASDKKNLTYFVTGTQTAATGNWTGTLTGITPYDGLTIRYYLPYAGSGNASLALNEGTAYPIYRYGTSTRITTHFPAGSIITMTFKSNSWIVDAFYYGDLYQRLYPTTSNVEYPILTRYNTTTGSSYYSEYGRYSTGVTLNPSTNTITATTFKGALSGNASTATALTSNAGDSNTPVYFSGGKPVACTSLDLNTSGSSASCTGNAATATKLKTARTISLTGSVTGSGSFDGSGNLSIATTTNHTHSYAGSSSAGGAATSLAGFKNTTTSGTAVDSFTTNGIGYVSGTSGIYSQSDGAMFCQAYNASWIAQIYQDYRTGQIALRGKNNGTWQAWRKVLDSSNYTSYVLKVGTATVGSATQPVYLNAGTPTACTYTLGKSVPSNAVFTDTDTKVTQAAAITTNGAYPLLLGYSTATTAVTNTVNKSSGLTFNPSTNALKIGSATLTYSSDALVISFA